MHTISYLSYWLLRSHQRTIKVVDTKQKHLKIKTNFIFEIVVDSTGRRNKLIHEISV